jgi:hypothetical protein
MLNVKLGLGISIVALVGSIGCAVQPQENLGDTGDESTASAAEDALTVSCGLSRASILAKATGARKTAIERGFAWYDAHVSYSQSRYHEGYRTDCSGFVSMCWQLGTSFTTADFIDGGGDDFLLPSYSSLVPGDALVHRSGGEGHVVLFLGWSDAAQSAACTLEEESTALDMQFHARTTSSLHSGGYHAIRADALR